MNLMAVERHEPRTRIARRKSGSKTPALQKNGSKDPPLRKTSRPALRSAQDKKAAATKMATSRPGRDECRRRYEEKHAPRGRLEGHGRRDVEAFA